ncbi:hypothetical protein [Endozoicomonas sp.]|uniref:hypothetical protein n=1 Tax=Endozoicomonas sp. TaxID=1892382 RepID=UPI0028882953|nr:hypothetical protein [Endozoicomonas sp.]
MYISSEGKDGAIESFNLHRREPSCKDRTGLLNVTQQVNHPLLLLEKKDDYI